jgi:hypothetical protein
MRDDRHGSLLQRDWVARDVVEACEHAARTRGDADENRVRPSSENERPSYEDIESVQADELPEPLMESHQDALGDVGIVSRATARAFGTGDGPHESYD